MPRKQNGWGGGQGFNFRAKPMTVSKGKAPGAAGLYPSNRYYGATVHRSVIEKYDLDSDWVKWRKGYEYYIKAAWDELVFANPLNGTWTLLNQPPEDYQEFVTAILESVLYQGTAYELPTLFYGWEFPTQDADTNTHYVAKRIPREPKQMGVLTEVWSDPIKYPEQKAAREIWCKGQVGVDARLLLQMPGERITDGETEATLKTVLTEDAKPAIYVGKTFPSEFQADSGDTAPPTVVTLEIPTANVDEVNDSGTFTVDQGLRTVEVEPLALPLEYDANQLIGKIIYIPNFYIDKLKEEVTNLTWLDGGNIPRDYFAVSITDIREGLDLSCLDPGVSTLPPSMYEINELPKIFTATGAKATITGLYFFQRKQYQKYFAPAFLEGETVGEIVERLSYALLPFTIQSAQIKDGILKIESVPFSSEVKFNPPLTENAILVFADNSFCKYTPADDGWTNMYTDVLPWQDEVFTSGQFIQPGQTYTCSCPNHSHAILAAPQSHEDLDTRRQNRQRRYPLPTVMGLDRWAALGQEQVSGKLVSWESEELRTSLKLCKHAIAARFIEKIRVIEPSSYPSVDARMKFEEKLEEEVKRFSYDFRLSYRRSQLTFTEIIFALTQGLNLDRIETAYVLLNSNR